MQKSIFQITTTLVAYTNTIAVGKKVDLETGSLIEGLGDSYLPQDQNEPGYGIVYPEGEEANIDLEPWKYPESFAWGRWCSATMISPRVALTAAHCVFDGMDGVAPRHNGRPISVTLTDPDPNVPESEYFTTTIAEIRSNECWFYEDYAVVWGGDLAILILEDEKPNAVEGVDYIRVWDDEKDGDVTGREFALMGWGLSGPVSDPEQGIWDFHRGYNIVRQVYENRIQYGFEDPEDTGLPLESVANSGDSGGSATIEVKDDDGNVVERVLIGVCSNGYGPLYRDEDDPYNTHEYIAIGGWQRSWVIDNLNSLEAGARVEATDQNCHAIEYATCEDTNFNKNGGTITDSYGDSCLLYTFYPQWCGRYDTNEFTSSEMCCVCDGGQARTQDDDDDQGDDISSPVQDLVDAAADAAANAVDLAFDAYTDLEIIGSRLSDFNIQYDTAEKQKEFATVAAASIADLLVDANTASDSPDALNAIKLAANMLYNAAREAATHANKAKNAGSKDRTAINQAAWRINGIQRDCADELEAVKAVLTTLEQDHAGEADAIATVSSYIEEAREAYEDLSEYGLTADLVAATNDQFNELKDLVSDTISAKNAAFSDNKAISELYDILFAPEIMFKTWVESFEFPKDQSGICRVQATRDTSYDRKFDYFIYYLVGDCTRTETKQVQFRGSKSSWQRSLEYEGEMTDLYRQSRSHRYFNLSNEDGKDRVAFGIEKRRARRFRPRSPRNVEVVTY